ncbi:MAG: helix-turn-helix domain-containing protein [Propionibacteriaceae bacterium]|nr:helix-turn-helix domain-containing protein [Propionibacteriaceae bacterium]
MAVTVNAAEDVVLPANDSTQIYELESFLSAHPDKLMLRAGNNSISLPPEVAQVLKSAVRLLADQMGVALNGVTTRLTTSEAAALLGISRPTLVRLLEEGQITYEQPRKHRLVLLEDVLRYQARMRNVAIVGQR